MKKYQTIAGSALFLAFLFLTAFFTCAEADTNDQKPDIGIATTKLHEWMPNIAYNSVDKEFLVVWFTNSTKKEDGSKLFSILAQRVSAEGALIGKAITLAPPGPDRKILPIITYNPLSNQYLVSLGMDRKETSIDPFIILLDHHGKIVSGPTCLSSKPKTASHVVVVFNSKRKQYLVAYNDSSSGNSDIYGFILSENGDVMKKDFEISAAKGDQINPYLFYNPDDDRYLVNWEDFRHVTHWKEPSNIYGALLDGDGKVIKNDIQMMEDHGLKDGGDQRHNTITYNSKKKEYLVCWMDDRPSLKNLGIVGRIVTSDGSLSGPPFVIDDAPGPQIFPQAIYSEKQDMYFVTWDDGRNDKPDAYWREIKNWDVYGIWLTSSGVPQGSDFPVCVKKDTQRYSRAVYAPDSDKFLVVWRDSNAPADIEPVAQKTGGHLQESKGDVRGTIYKKP